MSTNTQTQRIVERSPIVGVTGWFCVGVGLVVGGIGLATRELPMLVATAALAAVGLALRQAVGVTTIGPDGFEISFTPFARKRVRYGEIEDYWFVDKAGFADAGGIGWRIPRRGVRVLIMNDGPGVGMRLSSGLELRVAGPGGMALYEQLERRKSPGPPPSKNPRKASCAERRRKNEHSEHRPIYQGLIDD